MRKLVARSILSKLTNTSLVREVLVYYKTNESFYCGNEKYEHSDYALKKQEKIYEDKTRDRKVGYWWI